LFAGRASRRALRELEVAAGEADRLLKWERIEPLRAWLAEHQGEVIKRRVRRWLRGGVAVPVPMRQDQEGQRRP
jgi:hypothetical protein